MSSSFSDFLRLHRNGLTHDELSAALRDVVGAVEELRRVGKLTLTISIKPMGRGDGLEVGCEIKAAPPLPVPGTSLFFATPENGLTRSDPNQPTLELREIGPAEAHRGIA